MFVFITISNGMAVVQHDPTGYVYRFRPTHPGVWSRLTLDTIDACEDADAPEEHATAALVFAESAAVACCKAATEAWLPPQPSLPRARIQAGWLRQPVFN